MTKPYPLKWAGGKSYLADKIIRLFPPHLHYVEPDFGAGAVLFRKDPEGVSEVVNDLNGELTNFWDVLKTENLYTEFCRQVSRIPFSQVEWERSWAPAGDRKSFRGRLERAIRLFVRYRQSRQGLGKDFATLSKNRTRGGMSEQVSSWLSAIDSLPEAHARLRRVVILNDDAIKVIQREDGPNTLYYIDPPYLHETRTDTTAFGEYEMSDEDHANLLDTLGAVEGKFVLSGYPSKMYNRAAKTNGWNKHVFKVDNKASSAKKKEIKSECVWLNY
jgi:DNA adenine methylase